MAKAVIGSVVASLFILLTTACFRAETSRTAIHIPQMENERDSRIVTNAALNEVVGCITPIKHDYEFDLQNHVVLYHETQRLASVEYRVQLIESLKAVGLQANVVNAGFNPVKPKRLPDGDILNSWPDRFTAVISIPQLNSIQDANIVADALAFVRNGGDDPRVTPDPANHKLNIVYNNVALSKQNITEAIACTGYSANGVPPKNISNGWNVFTFSP